LEIPSWRYPSAAIKAAKGRGNPYKLTDSDGLYLLMTPAGGRYWRMNYRHLGKQKTLSFGVWPDTGLAEARAERDAARKVLAKDGDPAEQIKLERIAATVAAANSFKAVGDEWLAKAEREGRSAATMKKLRWLLDFIYVSIGSRAGGTRRRGRSARRVDRAKSCPPRGDHYTQGRRGLAPRDRDVRRPSQHQGGAAPSAACVRAAG